MIGTTLGDIRSHIEALASESGAYVLVCARYGDRPVPAAGLRFETRATARAAARATEQYRAALRRYDPRLPCYDVVVCQEGGRARRDAGTVGATEEREGSESEPDPGDRFGEDLGVAAGDRSNRVEYCHRVAAAVFEALSEAGHDGVESAVVDAYFELAERVPDLDDLCLCLLESMATEMERRLAPDEQAQVIDTAASRLPGLDATDHPIAATLAALERRELIGSYAWSPSGGEDGTEARGVVVRLSEYALSPRDDRLPVLPIVVELVRHHPEERLSSLGVVDVDDGWRIRFEAARDGESARDATPDALVSARIQSEG